MRVLHTSDWHLGRNFGAVSLHDHQVAFVDWLVAVVVAEQVDLVAIAGDVFDRAVPPTPAIDLLRSALLRLRAAGAQVALIAGNHDGPERMAAYDVLLDPSGVIVRGGYRCAGEVVTLEFADGPLDLVMLPYLDPVLEPVEAMVGEVGEVVERRRRTHHEVLAAAAERARLALRSPRSLALAHAFVVGASGTAAVSDSERQLTVGGTAEVRAEVFAPFSYTALGHLHTPQQVGGPTVRYSGTPLAYSFSETAAKQVVLVDLAADGVADVIELPVPVGRGVSTVRGTIDELLAAAPSAAVQHWVRAVVTDPVPVLHSKTRLAEVYPHIVEVDWQPVARAGQPAALAAEHRRRLSPAEVVEAYWAELHDVAPTADQRAVLHHAIDGALGG
jgi:exonuclease SbcD